MRFIERRDSVSRHTGIHHPFTSTVFFVVKHVKDVVSDKVAGRNKVNKLTKGGNLRCIMNSTV